MIYASEQAVILDRETADEAIEFMKENACYFLYDEELRKVEDVVINKEKGAVNPVVVGQSAHDIAKMAAVEVPRDTKILVAPIDGVGPNYPLSREKLELRYWPCI